MAGGIRPSFLLPDGTAVVAAGGREFGGPNKKQQLLNRLDDLAWQDLAEFNGKMGRVALLPAHARHAGGTYLYVGPAQPDAVPQGDRGRRKVGAIATGRKAKSRRG